MNVVEFRESLGHDAPPAALGKALQALWHAANGAWDTAHVLAQAQSDSTGAWVHAYLHRVEGDERNAGYWYRRAGKPHSKGPLPEEWEEIAAALLQASEN